jgi:hypothetical protein
MQEDKSQIFYVQLQKEGEQASWSLGLGLIADLVLAMPRGFGPINLPSYFSQTMCHFTQC